MTALNKTIEIEQPFVADMGAAITENTGLSARERIDSEVPDVLVEADDDEYKGVAQVRNFDAIQARVLADYEWYTDSKGKRRLRAKQALVDRYVKELPTFHDRAIIRFRNTEPERYSHAMALGTMLADFLDSNKEEDEVGVRYIGQGIAKELNNAMAFAYELAHDYVIQKGRLNRDRPEPEWIGTKRAKMHDAVNKAAFFAVQSDVARLTINWRDITYQYLNRQAYRNQQTLETPNAGPSGAQNEHNASDALDDAFDTAPDRT